MIIKKTVEEMVWVTKENAKDILKFVEYSDWRYEFVKAIADGKDVEVLSESGMWVQSCGYSFSEPPEDYRIAEPDHRIDLSNSKVLFVQYLLPFSIDNLVDSMNEIRKQIPIISEKIEYDEIISSDIIIIEFFIPKYTEIVLYVLKNRYGIINTYITEEKFRKTYKNANKKILSINS